MAVTGQQIYPPLYDLVQNLRCLASHGNSVQIWFVDHEVHVFDVAAVGAPCVCRIIPLGDGVEDVASARGILFHERGP